MVALAYGRVARNDPPNVPPAYVPDNLSATAAPSVPVEDGKVRVTDAEPPLAMSPNDAGIVVPLVEPSVACVS